MIISSRAYDNNGRIPSDYTCDSVVGTKAGQKGINPPFLIEDIPEEARSLIVIIEDIDSKNGGVNGTVNGGVVGSFYHWVIVNIPVQSQDFYIEEDSIPEGDICRASTGDNTYVPPCPHDPATGEHRYVTTVYALTGGIEGEPSNITNLTGDEVKSLLENGATENVTTITASNTASPRPALQKVYLPPSVHVLASTSMTGRYKRV